MKFALEKATKLRDEMTCTKIIENFISVAKTMREIRKRQPRILIDRIWGAARFGARSTSLHSIYKQNSGLLRRLQSIFVR